MTDGNTIIIPQSGEVWRDVPGYEGRYQVSNMGRVRSVERTVPTCRGAVRLQRSRILKQTIGSHGYPGVALCNGGSRGKTYTVHSLVARAFLGPRPAGMETRHKNGRRDDPRAENLEYCTNQENQHDRRRHGTHNFGARNPVAKLTEDQVRLCRLLRKSNNATYASLARALKVSESTVRDACTRKTWGHLA